MYQFKVEDVKQIDLARIVTEAQVDAAMNGNIPNVIVVASPKAKQCLVLLSEAFLAQFNDGDHVFIADVQLFPECGDRETHPSQETRHKIEWYIPWGNETTPNLPDGWKAIVVEDSERTRRQIERAISYKRELVLRVETF